MKTKTLAAAFIGVVALGASCASAKGSGDRMEMLSKADANQDGAITWDEVIEMRASMFSRLDRNADGYANMADRPRGRFGRGYEDKLAELTPQFDVNRDGSISRNEFVNAPSLAFELGDLDDDKTLSADELAALRTANGFKTDDNG